MTKQKAKKIKKEAKKKDVARSPMRRNRTDHERAMRDPHVREIFSELQSNWNDLTSQQTGEQLKKLKELGCTGQGLARDLGRPETDIRRKIKEAKSSDERGDCSEAKERTLAKKPQRRKAISAVEASHESTDMFQKNRKAEPVIKKSSQVQYHAHLSTAQQSNKGASASLFAANESDVVNGGKSEQVDQARDSSPKTSLADQYMLSRGPITPDQLKQLNEISKQMEEQRVKKLSWSARTMKPQGRSIPPEKG